MNCKDKMCGALDCDTCHPERNWPHPVSAAQACANEIAEEYTHTKYTEGIAEIIEQHYPKPPIGKQLVSEEAISWLFKNHPDAYLGFYERL
jgi:hypothetical protein